MTCGVLFIGTEGTLVWSVSLPRGGFAGGRVEVWGGGAEVERGRDLGWGGGSSISGDGTLRGNLGLEMIFISCSGTRAEN